MTTDPTRPIIGIENRTPQEVFAIMADRIRAMLEAAPTPPSAPGVRVRKLEWLPYPNPVFAGPDVAVSPITAFGDQLYQVQRDPWGHDFMAFLAPKHGTLFWEAKGFGDIEAAKAAAQADFEARILSTLEPSPQPIADGGWRPIDGAPKDKSPVILAVPNNGHAGYIVGEAYFDPETRGGGDWWWAGTNYGDYYAGPISEVNYYPPTHWMPLPAPPAALNEGSGQ